MSELSNSGKVFVYGTLTNPQRTEQDFDCDHVGRATTRGLRKVGNNVKPADERVTVEGQVFEVHDFTAMDRFESSHAYLRFVGRTTDGEPIYFYSIVHHHVHEEAMRDEFDVEVEIHE